MTDIPPILDLRADPKARVERAFMDQPRPARTFVVLAPQVTLLYRWGNHGNTRRWHDPEKGEGVIDVAHRLRDESGATGPEDIVVARGEVILGRWQSSLKWSGVRTKYTPWVHDTVRELLRRGLIRPRTRVLAGSWASLEGDFLGTARALARRPQIPPSLVLYHGTASHRLVEIQQEGLHPQPTERRAWKRERRPAPHRVSAIYLTADRSQAVYYAERAVRVARRAGWTGVQPVLLSLRLRRREYGKLRADDDWLGLQRGKGEQADPGDWYGSLVGFGQVALVGSIPPGKIRVEEVTPR